MKFDESGMLPSRRPGLNPHDPSTINSGLISVIIPTFNRAQLVPDAMDSVARQTYPNIELLIVNDGSADDTRQVLDDWSANRPAFALKIIEQKNAGASAARNAGVAASSGEFIYFLDSDDLIYPEALQELVTLLCNESAPYVLANIWNADFDGNILYSEKSGISRQCSKNIFRNGWMTHAGLYRRNILHISGLFNQALKVGEDSEFHWRLAESVGPGVMLDKRIGLRRLHHFGHLSTNQSHAHSVRVIEAYTDWLEESGRKGKALSTPALGSIFALALRCGKDGEFALMGRALDLFERLSREGSLKNRITRSIGKHKSQAYFGILLAVAEKINLLRLFVLPPRDYWLTGFHISQPVSSRTKLSQ